MLGKTALSAILSVCAVFPALADNIDAADCLIGYQTGPAEYTPLGIGSVKSNDSRISFYANDGSIIIEQSFKDTQLSIEKNPHGICGISPDARVCKFQADRRHITFTISNSRLYGVLYSASCATASMKVNK